MSVQDIFHSFMEKFQITANVGIVFGSPVEFEDKMIIPLAKTQYAFGAGGASLALNTDNNDNSDAGGGGGGIKTTPVGVLEITKEKTRFIPTFSISDIVMLLSIIFTFIYRIIKIQRKAKRNESI
ncbi:MAG: spore germination protein GerW family protein [Candidatus Cloacimonadales bacterium]|jgi:uncharacterized spore protein YtfJ|nr:spore germination protein GerW family protein [Candidatus Cloacimonadales bacterium]